MTLAPTVSSALWVEVNNYFILFFYSKDLLCLLIRVAIQVQEYGLL